MKLAEFDVQLAETDVKCDSCTEKAILLINGQSQCAQDAGMRLQAEPEVFATLVAVVLTAAGERPTPVFAAAS